MGASDGEATVLGSGGTGINYTYEWVTPPINQLTATATGLGAGTYNVIIRDENGCSHTESVTLTEPTSVSGTASVVVNPAFNGAHLSCFGTSDGAITAQGTGGIAPYTYQWGTNAGKCIYTKCFSSRFGYI